MRDKTRDDLQHSPAIMSIDMSTMGKAIVDNRNGGTARPLVSVVVPVYGVEHYLRECVDSILSQTYTNLEVILVDDGSPDACGVICDEYAARDARIRVIHQVNGGLSVARNAALDIATGEYVGFVDSDDTIDPAMYEVLVSEALVANAEIVACGYCMGEFGSARQDGSVVACADVDFSCSVDIRGARKRYDLSGPEAILLLLKDDELQNYVWNKLFAMRLWNGVRFPVNQKFEDVNTVYKVVELASNVVLLPDSLYFYRIRADGIVRSCTLLAEIDCVDANLQRYEVLRERYPQACRLMIDGVLRAMIKVWPLAWQQRAHLTGPMRVKLEHFAAFAKGHTHETELAGCLGPTGRATLALLPYARPWAWGLSWVLYRVYSMRHRSW